MDVRLSGEVGYVRKQLESVRCIRNHPILSFHSRLLWIVYLLMWAGVTLRCTVTSLSSLISDFLTFVCLATELEKQDVYIRKKVCQLRNRSVRKRDY